MSHTGYAKIEGDIKMNDSRIDKYSDIFCKERKTSNSDRNKELIYKKGYRYVSQVKRHSRRYISKKLFTNT